MTVNLELEPLEQVVAGLGKAAGDGPSPPSPPARGRAPLLAALRRAGTRHIYADSADPAEIAGLSGPGGFPEELDGNTANQPLVHEVLERILDAGDPGAWLRELEARREKLLGQELLISMYTIVCGLVGNAMERTFGTDATWETSIQIHMDLCGRREPSIRAGHLIHEMVPRALVKVPFTPDDPGCILVARDLERAGIPVNFTSTFSARQAVAAALLADVSRANIFMGRLSEGLKTDLLGEQVDLEAQRALAALRREGKSKTRLIVASVHTWRTFERTAGCDVYTAPVPVIRDFLEQTEVAETAVRSRLETSYEDDLQVPSTVRDRLGKDGISRLSRVEPEFIAFLEAYRKDPEFLLADGEILYKRFHQAGFGDLFHAPDTSERQEMEQGKLPDLDGALIRRVPIDTHMSLLANADFQRHQRSMDAVILQRLDRGGGA